MNLGLQRRRKLMRWKPRLDRSRRPPAVLRTILRFSPLSLGGLGIEAMYPAAPWLLGLLEYVYYGVVGLFALHLLLDFTQAVCVTGLVVQTHLSISRPSGKS
jgi:hypothetical protein